MAKAKRRAQPRHKLDEASGRLRRSVVRPPYKVVAVGLYDDQARSLDTAASDLQAAGLNQANRSFLVQALVRKFQHDTAGKTPEELLTLFVDNYLRQPLALAPARSEAHDRESMPATATKQRSSTRPRRHIG